MIDKSVRLIPTRPGTALTISLATLREGRKMHPYNDRARMSGAIHCPRSTGSRDGRENDEDRQQ
jgi:hypothetical protein